MGLIERVQLHFYNENSIARLNQFTANTFALLIPRGAIGRITRGELLMTFRDTQGLLVDVTAFAWVVRTTTAPAGDPAAGAPFIGLAVMRQQGILPVMLGQRAQGVVSDKVVQSVAATSARNFVNEPHRTAEIRNTGRNADQPNGWSIVHWCTGNDSTPLSLWGQLEVEIEYVETARPTAPLPRRQRIEVMNQ